MDAILTYRKRVITQDDLSLLRQVIERHWSEGRSVISRRICEAWDWRQTNGYLKDGVCRGLLLKLEGEGILLFHLGFGGCSEFSVSKLKAALYSSKGELT